MKFILTFSVILALSGATWGQSKSIDKIAAQIGDEIILRSDIEGQKLQAMQAGVTVTPEMNCQILEELMYSKLLLNQAQLDSIEVTSAQVDAEMEQRIRVIESKFNGDRQRMEDFYGKTVAQMKNEFRTAIRDQLLAQEMERQITAEVSVTPREVRKFYDQIPFDSIPLINTQLSFQQIVHYPEITADDKARAHASLVEIRKNIMEKGKSFSTQARIHSMDPGSASQGGEIRATRGMMVPPFEAAVFSLEVDQVSEVFESTYGYHIVKLIDRKGDDYVCQHILIIPEFAPDAMEASAIKIDSCYRELMAGTITWNEAVKKYSNDEATLQNSGIITNPISGEQTWDMEDLNQVDQQIYLITDAMEPGDISEPNLYTNIFERKQGVRIVRLMDRTAPHRANLNDDYSLIQRAAENDKKQKIIAKWTKDKIQNAYIRIDEEYHNCDFVNPWLPK